jgi:hypothetical protein
LKTLWQRPDLSKRDCRIVTLSVIIARNHTVEFRFDLTYCFETPLLKDRFGRSMPTAVKGTSAGLPLDFWLLGYFERVIDLDSKITHRALKLGMPEQQLNGPQVLRAPVDQRCFCPPHCVGAISSIQADRTHPGSMDACVLPRGQVGRLRTPAWKQALIGCKPCLVDPASD